LVVADPVGGTDSSGLPVRFHRELFGSHVRHPDLNKAKSLLAHPLPMRTHTIPHRHPPMLHVTREGVHEHDLDAVVSTTVDLGVDAKVGPLSRGHLGSARRSTHVTVSPAVKALRDQPVDLPGVG